jgi:hypothetical protein
MPGTFPAGTPTLSGDLLSISRFLASPTAIARRLRDFRDLRFVSDQILTQRFRSSGGAVLVTQSEPFVNPRAVESVAPGSEYPMSPTQLGTAVIAQVQKWGQATEVTDEEITRSVFGGAVVDRALRKTINTVIRQVDQVALAAVAAAVTQTRAATATWSTLATANPFYDIQNAVADIYALNLGYNPDTVLMGDLKYAQLTANPIVSNLLRREATDNPIYTGTIDQISNLTIVRSPNLPTNDVWVIDSTQLGGMADEVDGAPGYTVSDMAVQIQTEREADRDAWDMWGRRKTVPVVQEPGAAIRITGS